MQVSTVCFFVFSILGWKVSPWVKVTKPAFTFTVHSSVADIIHSGSFNYHMPMISKFIFQPIPLF